MKFGFDFLKRVHVCRFKIHAGKQSLCVEGHDRVVSDERGWGDMDLPCLLEKKKFIDVCLINNKLAFILGPKIC